MRLVALIAISLSSCLVTEVSPEVPVERLDPRLQPAFDELKAALDEGSDDVARAILTRLQPRCRDELSLRIAAGYERILEGRAVRDSVEAWVEVCEVPGGFEAKLAMRHDMGEEVILSPGYVRVEWTAWSVDVMGRQSAQVGGRVVSAEEGWQLPEGAMAEVPLGVDSPRVGDGALAVRIEWRVSLGAGSASFSGGLVPVQGVDVEHGAVVRLSKDLSTAPVEPEELWRYAVSGEVRLAALLERAVRVHPSRYDEALDLFASRQDELSPEALGELTPVIAWLTGTTGISAAGEDWRSWLEDRGARKEQGDELDLPDDLGR